MAVPVFYPNEFAARRFVEQYVTWVSMHMKQAQLQDLSDCRHDASRQAHLCLDAGPSSFYDCVSASVTFSDCKCTAVHSELVSWDSIPK